MTVAEMATYGLPDNRPPGGNTYKQQVRSMALQPEQRNQQAIDRCVFMFRVHFCLAKANEKVCYHFIRKMLCIHSAFVWYPYLAISLSHWKDTPLKPKQGS